MQASTIPMQVTLETAEGLKRHLKVVIPAEHVETLMDEWFKKKGPSAKMQGFRPGKIPPKILKENFSGQAYEEVLQRLLSDSVSLALEQEKLNPVAMPAIELVSANIKGPLEYIAKFEVFPEITLKGLNGVTIEKLVAQVEEADIDRAIENLSKQYVEWKEVNRAAQKGDKVKIDFKGFIDGEPLKNGAAEDFDMVLGEANMIPGFEDGVMGATPGQTLTLNLKFPDEYHATEIAGKPVIFEITVKTVSEPVLPVLDDAFAARMGIPEGGMEALRREMKKTMVNALESRIKRILHEEVVKKLSELNPIEVPTVLIQQEAKRMQQEFMQRMGAPKSEISRAQEPMDVFLEQAKQQVAIGLLLSDLFEEFKNKLDENRVDQIIRQIASSYQNEEEIVSLYYKDKAKLAEIKSQVLEEQVMQKLLEAANVTDKTSTYQEIMK